MYFAYDGDRIGSKLESLIIDNDEEKIENFANTVLDALERLESSLKKSGCKIIFASGDSILAKSTDELVDVNSIDREYGNITFSLGIGSTPLEAMLALKKAKSTGIAEYKSYTFSE